MIGRKETISRKTKKCDAEHKLKCGCPKRRKKMNQEIVYTSNNETNAIYSDRLPDGGTTSLSLVKKKKGSSRKKVTASSLATNATRGLVNLLLIFVRIVFRISSEFRVL